VGATVLVGHHAIIAWHQILRIDPSDDLDAYLAAYLTAFAMLGLLPLILLSVAPARAATRRLIFLGLGLLLLTALNELSKLGLDVTAPKLQG
jgi:hypothetical protein